jgi:hypothetical protein
VLGAGSLSGNISAPTPSSAPVSSAVPSVNRAAPH